MASHGCGAPGARALATGDWADLVAGLAGSMYGAGLAPSANRAVVRGHCSEVVVWNLRVLAGWVPTGSLAMLRALVGEFEIDNIDAHLRHLESGSAPPPLELGALAIAWPRVQSCSTPDEVRDVLRFSSWGDPGGADAVSPRGRPSGVVGSTSPATRARCRAMGAGRSSHRGRPRALRVRSRAQHRSPHRRSTVSSVASGGRPRRSANSSTLSGLRPVGSSMEWTTPNDLWHAEGAWWTRVEADATSMVDSARPDRAGRRRRGRQRCWSICIVCMRRSRRPGEDPPRSRCSMPWRDRLTPARMCRAAIVAPRSRWRAVLVHTADAGCVPT